MLRKCATVCTLLLITCSILYAQNNTLTLKRSVVNSGGGTSNNGGLTLTGSVSQSVIGKTHGTQYAKGVGFWYTFIDRVAVSSGPAPAPGSFSLGLNYPNPFSEQTTIPFSIRQTGTYTLAIYSIDGRNLATLTESAYGPGTYSIVFHPRGLQQGVYFVRLSGSGHSLQRMIVHTGR